MEEKQKIKDLTGNREERIAEKKTAPAKRGDGAGKHARRPFARPASGAASSFHEHISEKPAGTSEGKNSEEPRREPSARRPFERRAEGGRPQARGKGHAESRSTAEKRSVQQDGERRPAEEKNTVKRNDRRPKNGSVKPVAKTDRKPPAKDAVQSGAPNASGPGTGSGSRRSSGAKSSVRQAQQPVTPGPSDAFAEEPVYRFTEEELRADGLLFQLDEPVPPARPQSEQEPQEQVEVVSIRFRGAGKSYSFAPNGISFAEGEHAIVETVRGMEYGEVVHANHLSPVGELVQPLKPVLRKATAEDDARDQANRRMEEEARPVFLEKVQKNKLEMQLVDIEYTFDNAKLCFYFTADGRVDFRELVKDLAAVFRTRIELRQIGVRDEARMCGGLGICGRPFCCKSFLADFTQVSIKMAKEQNLALASAKISGSCGRLMCCLRYEQETYERESAALPRPGSVVGTPQGDAKVLESNFLTNQIKVLGLADNTVRYFRPAEVRVAAAQVSTNSPNDAKEESAGQGMAASESEAAADPVAVGNLEDSAPGRKPFSAR